MSFVLIEVSWQNTDPQSTFFFLVTSDSFVCEQNSFKGCVALGRFAIGGLRVQSIGSEWPGFGDTAEW